MLHLAKGFLGNCGDELHVASTRTYGKFALIVVICTASMPPPREHKLKKYCGKTRASLRREAKQGVGHSMGWFW